MIRVIIDEMNKAGEDFRLLVMPDHPTPIRCRTHTSDSIPYLLYDSTKPVNGGCTLYNEAQAKATGKLIEHGYELIDQLLGE